MKKSLPCPQAECEQSGACGNESCRRQKSCETLLQIEKSSALGREKRDAYVPPRDCSFYPLRHEKDPDILQFTAIKIQKEHSYLLKEHHSLTSLLSDTCSIRDTIMLPTFQISENKSCLQIQLRSALPSRIESASAKSSLDQMSFCLVLSFVSNFPIFLSISFLEMFSIHLQMFSDSCRSRRIQTCRRRNHTPTLSTCVLEWIVDI